jgi:uncharacterized repeat protein (TIGR01451 family)
MMILEKKKKILNPDKLFLFILFLYLFFIPNIIFSASCTPTMAVICVAPDDHAWVYINGNFIDEFHYVNWDETGVPKCVTLTSTQLSSLQPTGNIIAVRNLNTNCCEIWSSWSLDVYCSGGGHSYTSSADTSGISMYHDNTPCPADTPVPSGGYQWYQGSYNQSGSGLSWVAPTIVTGQKWGKRIWDPQTGNLLPALGYSVSSTAGTNDCMQLFYRQPFDLPVEPTPAPPNFTITKSANPSSNIGQSPPDTITFTLHICNTGGGTFGNQVVIYDDWVDALDNWAYFGPGDYTDSLFGAIDEEHSGKGVTITFKDGFLGNTCYDYIFRVGLYSGTATYCNVWHNIARLSYLAQPTRVATATLNNYCPPPPNFTLVKSASKTTMTGRDEPLTFTMRLCNTGGAAWTGTMYLVDDMTSAPGDWQYEGPYYWGSPATGIDHISTSGATTLKTYEIVFKQPGFTGCLDIPFYTKTGYNYGCGPWHNDAILQSYMGSPTIVSTVNMQNICSPSFTPTRTYTRTPVYTFTRTNTPGGPSPTFTPTRTPTFSSTPTATSTISSLSIQLTKTINTNIAMLGDTITYCLYYRNNGSSAASFRIWDTIPSVTDLVGGDSGYFTTLSGSDTIIYWDLTNVPAGGTGQRCFWVRVSRLPYLIPLQYNVIALLKRNNILFEHDLITYIKDERRQE